MLRSLFFHQELGSGALRLPAPTSPATPVDMSVGVAGLGSRDRYTHVVKLDETGVSVYQPKQVNCPFANTTSTTAAWLYSVQATVVRIVPFRPALKLVLPWASFS